MGTVTELGELIRKMKPRLRDGEYYLSSVDDSRLMDIAVHLGHIADVFREDEGISVVFSGQILEEMRGLSKSEPVGPFAWITLDVYSDLMAVGFLARITEVLAKEEISVNAFSAYHHDHLFVPYGQRGSAMDVLGALSTESV